MLVQASRIDDAAEAAATEEQAPAQAAAPATSLPAPPPQRLVQPGLLSPKDTRTVAQELAISATLRTLGEAELIELAPRCIRTVRKPGEAVVVQGGSDSQAMYIVVEGLLRVMVRAGDGEEREVNTLCAGETFGEQSLLLSRPRTATIETVTDCVLLEISRGVLAPLLRLQPTLTMRLAELHAARTHGGERSELEQTVRLICESFGIAKRRVLMDWGAHSACLLLRESRTIGLDAMRYLLDSNRYILKMTRSDTVSRQVPTTGRATPTAGAGRGGWCAGAAAAGRRASAGRRPRAGCGRWAPPSRRHPVVKRVHVSL